MKVYTKTSLMDIGTLTPISLFSFPLIDEDGRYIGRLKGEDIEKELDSLGFVIVKKEDKVKVALKNGTTKR